MKVFFAGSGCFLFHRECIVGQLRVVGARWTSAWDGEAIRLAQSPTIKISKKYILLARIVLGETCTENGHVLFKYHLSQCVCLISSGRSTAWGHSACRMLLGPSLVTVIPHHDWLDRA